MISPGAAVLAAALASSPTFCWKESYPRGAGSAPAKCARGEERNGPLCYPKCKAGFGGVGPVCWQSCPRDRPFNCGAGCAADQGQCLGNVVNMVAAPTEVVAQVVLLVLTDGASVGVIAGAKAAAKGAAVGGRVAVKVAMSATARASAKAAAKEALRKRARELKRDLKDEALDTAAGALVQLQENGQLDWKDLDPTGLANVVDAFSKPLCSR